MNVGFKKSQAVGFKLIIEILLFVGFQVVQGTFTFTFKKSGFNGSGWPVVKAFFLFYYNTVNDQGNFFNVFRVGFRVYYSYTIVIHLNSGISLLLKYFEFVFHGTAFF